MPLEAVIFDWGGTLSVWADVDLEDMWRLAARRIDPDNERELVARLIDIERDAWREVESTHTSTTLASLLERAAVALGVEAGDEILEEAAGHHLGAWTPHVEHDPDAPHVLAEIRSRGLKVGLLSNTFWPRAWHEHFLERDGLIDLIDARVYTSDLPFTKPHPSSFAQALASVEVNDPARALFVGDRPFDDIHGAKSAGLTAVLRPNPAVPPYDGAEPDAVIESLPELIAIVDRLI